MDPVDKYLERHAEPEIRAALSIEGSYRAALIVPVCRERITLLDGYVSSAAALPGRLLVVLVVNAASDAPESVHVENARLLVELTERFPDAVPLAAAGGGLAAGAAFDVLWIDRASSGLRLPERQGVGLARKIGADLALALWRRGRLELPWLFGSDADATLPADYFTAPGTIEAAAVLYPFEHVPGGDPDVDRATQLYEVALRYYTLGLAWAGSPYAYHSLGSTFAVHAESYAKVRGFPKRTAGEDFYLLDKLAKIGALHRLATEPVAIASRRSDRVPFGTGRRVAEIAAGCASGSEPKLYNPDVFFGLNAWLSVLERFVAHREVGELAAKLSNARSGLGGRVLAVIEAEGGLDELAIAARQSPKPAVLRRRLHTWFDALRTLRLVHALRDSGSVGLPFGEALASAPFSREVAHAGDPRELSRALAGLERRYGSRIGVCV